jgi:hypothetical protein
MCQVPCETLRPSESPKWQRYRYDKGLQNPKSGLKPWPQLELPSDDDPAIRNHPRLQKSVYCQIGLFLRNKSPVLLKYMTASDRSATMQSELPKLAAGVPSSSTSGWIALTPDRGVMKRTVSIVLTTGSSCDKAKRVKLAYEGRVEGGDIFDSSSGYGVWLEPDALIPGFAIGLRACCVGEIAEIRITPAYGYGAKEGDVLQAETLIFSINVHEIEASRTATQGTDKSATSSSAASAIRSAGDDARARREVELAAVEARKAAAALRSAALSAKSGGKGKKK